MEEEVFKLKPAEDFIFDLYSARAMSSIMGTLEWKEVDDADETYDYSVIAVAAFDMTEAMILERRKRKGL